MKLKKFSKYMTLSPL